MAKSRTKTPDWQIARAKARGTAQQRAAAIALFQPIQNDGKAPQLPASSPADRDPQKRGSTGDASLRLRKQRESSMSEHDFLGEETGEFDGFGYIGAAIKGTVSVAAIMAPWCALLHLPGDQREQHGLSRDGECEMARVLGSVKGLSDPFDLPAANGRPARRTYGLIGQLEVVNMIDGTISSVSGDSVLFLPGAVHSRIVSDVRDELTGLAGGTVALGIAYSLCAYARSTMYNPKGHSWTGYSLQEPRKVDPLAALRHKVMALDLKALKAAQPRLLLKQRPPLTIDADAAE